MAAAERSPLRIEDPDLHTLQHCAEIFNGDFAAQSFASYMGTAEPLRMENRLIDIAVFAFVLFFIVPLVISAVLYALGDRVREWRTADRSSAGLLPPARTDQRAVVRIFSARTVRWRGIIATHSWIVVKEANSPAYSRFDCTAWGEVRHGINRGRR